MQIAIIENGKVTNIVMGELDEVAQLFDEVVEITEATNQAWIGARYNGEVFASQPSYPSWVFDEETFSYVAPEPKPEGKYAWNEETLSWEEIIQPFPSWTWDENNYTYVAPKPSPETADLTVHEWDESLGDWVVCAECTQKNK